MRACEFSGLRTAFPHPVDQYEQIVSKTWMSTLCTDARARLPAATQVSKSSVLADSTRSAKRALAVLEHIRATGPWGAQGGKGKRGPSVVNADGVKKGVVKLGLSWEARYVAIFEGEEDLAVKLTEMMSHPGSLATSCIVQEWVDFDFEMRLYFFPPADWTPSQKLSPARVECNSWSGSMDGGQRRNFHLVSKADALSWYWEQDDAAWEAAKKDAIDAAQHLLAWLLQLNAEMVPMIRLDFMLKRLGPGSVRVVFGEFCEMGACCLGWEKGPPTVWRAAVGWALR